MADDERFLRIIFATPNVANIAQLVEQLTRNEQVTGSSPVVGSLKCSPVALCCGRFFFCVTFAPHKRSLRIELLSENFRCPAFEHH